MAMWVWKCNVQPAPASLVPEQKKKKHIKRTAFLINQSYTVQPYIIK